VFIAFIGLVIQPWAWLIGGAQEEGLARSLDARIADLAAREGKEKSLQQEIYALEILTEFEGSS
jgi:hypothetical protein